MCQVNVVCALVQEEVSAEVNVLLALKKQYKDLTGEDFVPAQQPKKPDTAAVKAKQAEPGQKAEQKKKPDQGRGVEKPDGSAKNEKERLNVKGKANTDSSQQSSVQESHADKDGSGAREVKKATR